MKPMVHRAGGVCAAQTFPVTSKTLNYSGVAVGIATLAAIFFWFMPFGLGARSWYRGKIETAKIGFDSVGEL